MSFFGLFGGTPADELGLPDNYGHGKHAAEDNSTEAEYQYVISLCSPGRVCPTDSGDSAHEQWVKDQMAAIAARVDFVVNTEREVTENDPVYVNKQ